MHASASEGPTKKVLVLTADGEVATDEEPEPLSNNEEEEEDTLPFDEEALMMKWLLSTQPSSTEETQRENIFHARVSVFGQGVYIDHRLWILHECSLNTNSGEVGIEDLTPPSFIQITVA